MVNMLHAGLANTALLYFLVVSVWGYVRFFRKQGLDSSYWGALAIAEILVVLQAVMGGYLWIVGFRPARTMHLLYGILIPAMIPGAYFYTKGEEGRSELIVYATVTIITVGLLIRAIFTGEVVI